ncbi:hypothetical protein [Caballeronia mineralivorans]|uniref:hypothetical protein n=1 Tax=Caballeronia mineralivorans TaxID=2010198 RepID=UPI0009E54EBA
MKLPDGEHFVQRHGGKSIVLARFFAPVHAIVPLSLLRPNDLIIRAWLGHVSLDTTNICAAADLEMKVNALAHCDLPPPAKREKKRRRLSEHLDVTAVRGRPRIQDVREAPPGLRIHGTIGVAMRAFLAR